MRKRSRKTRILLFADIMVYRNKMGSSGIFKKEIYRNLTRACDIVSFIFSLLNYFLGGQISFSLSESVTQRCSGTKVGVI